MQLGRNAMGVAGSLLGTMVAMLLYYLLLQPLLLRAGVILSQWKRALLRTAAAYVGPFQPPTGSSGGGGSGAQDRWLRAWGWGGRVGTGSSSSGSSGGAGSSSQQQQQMRQQVWEEGGNGSDTSEPGGSPAGPSSRRRWPASRLDAA